MIIVYTHFHSKTVRLCSITEVKGKTLPKKSFSSLAQGGAPSHDSTHNFADQSMKKPSNFTFGRIIISMEATSCVIILLPLINGFFDVNAMDVLCSDLLIVDLLIC